MNRRLVPFSILSVLLLTPAAYLLPQEQRSGHFEAEGKVKVSIDYLLFVPEAVEGKKLPMIVFLHGAGERGDNVEKVKVHGPPKIVEKNKDFPFVVLSPQCKRGKRWNPDALMSLIEDAAKKCSVDEDRIYLTGLSMGGYGTWALAAKYPDRFAAIAPICGGGNPRSAAALKSLPIWVFHGAKDSVVPIDQSRRMVDALKALGNAVKFTVYPGVNHDSWTETYANPKLYEWFLQHKRGPAAKRLLPSTKPDKVGLSPEKLGGIDDVVQDFVDDEKIAGAIVMVARRGKVAYAKAFGKMDLGAGKAMKRDTILRFYSMSKPVTSVATLMLVEEGKVGLDDPVSKHLPEFKGAKVYKSGAGKDLELESSRREMTVRDLLRHTSGLTYGIFGNTEIDKMYRSAAMLDGGATLEDMVGKLGKIPLLNQPGSRWNYSVSTDVLGRLVEVASGKRFDEFLQTRIFGPLGMVDTGFHVPPEKVERFAANYGPKDGGGLRAIDSSAQSKFCKPATFFSGGGGLVSTAMDYMKFCQMLLNKGELGGKRLLRRKAVEQMVSDQLPKEASPIQFGGFPRMGVGFGLGVSVRVATSAMEPASRVGEYGWGGAASTHFWISPKDGIIVLALSQYMPFSSRLESALKPIIYEAIMETAAVPGGVQ